MELKIVFQSMSDETGEILYEQIKNILKKTADYPENIELDRDTGVISIRFFTLYIQYPALARHVLNEINQFISTAIL